MRFAATFDAGDIRKGAAEAVASLKNVSGEAGKTASALDATGGAFRKAAKESGYFYDRLGRLHAANGKYASSAQKAAIQTKAVGSSSEKAGKQMQGFGSGSDSASRSLAHASSVADALNQRFASLTQRVLSVYAAYKLLDSVVATTNIGIQANKNWESQKLAIASIVSSTNQLADAQGRVLEGAEKFTASQQVAEELMKRIQQLGLETTATTQELVTGFQAIIAPALKAGYALEELPELATRAAQAMGAFQIPIQQMRTEIESLLSGNINRAQDLLAGYLNVTGKMIKDWKAQGILVEEINKRLESFRYSSDAIANTWAGLTSNIQEYFELISRGSTSGLFDSMKSSVRELQSLMISMNKDTGLAEVSSKVNNIAEAWRRMNDFIGNKILVSTGRFTDWIEELNNPENLAVFETTLSNIWTGIENGASLIGKVSSAFGELSSKAISGWNSMPEIIRDVGIAGAMLYGKRGLLIFGTAKRPDQNCEGTDAAWRLVGPTNQYAMLDQYVSTQTVAAEDVMTFTVTFNRCTAFALLNFKATSIRAVVKDGDGLAMYDRTVNTLKDVDGYWNYYFLPLERIVDQAVTNIPMSPVATLYVSLTQEGGPALGQVIAGQAWFIGMTQYNTRLGIRDYSRKDTDEFGNTRLVKRANAKRTSLPLYLHPSRLDSVREILARMHGLPALWLGDDNEGIGSYQSLTVWGWLEDWSSTIIGPNEVSMNIDVQGLK